MKRLHAGDHCTFTSPLLYFGDWLKYTTDGRHMYTLCFYVLDIKCCIFFITAWGWGDPHITTLDDEVYTFNGLGEYTLLQLTPASDNDDFTLQGRTELVVNSTATQFSAFAFGSPSADMVEVSILHTQVHIHILQLLNKHAVIIESHSNKFARTTL